MKHEFLHSVRHSPKMLMASRQDNYSNACRHISIAISNIKKEVFVINAIFMMPDCF